MAILTLEMNRALSFIKCHHIIKDVMIFDIIQSAVLATLVLAKIVFGLVSSSTDVTDRHRRNGVMSGTIEISINDGPSATLENL